MLEISLPRAKSTDLTLCFCIDFYQKWFKKTFPKGIKDVKVGYLGGSSENPSYKVRIF